MTNTGVKFVIVVDQGSNMSSGRIGGLGGAVRESDLKPVCLVILNEMRNAC